MELPSQEGEIPIPINSSYGGVVHPHNHMIHHDPTPQNHIIPTSTPANGPISTNGPLRTTLDETIVVPYKKMVKYRECLKNHAASMGGNATDGCGEFMPSGEEGTIEALTCSACHCHRNFHRKEIEGDPSICEYFHHNPHLSRVGRKVLLGHHTNILSPEALGYHHSSGPIRASGPVVGPHNQMIMSYNLGPMPSESDEDGGGGGGMMGRAAQMVKKRFRTKFSQEQKEKMLNFAEKVGWKIQKQEETMVQQFCQEIGVKRRVLKVWMHNNKHNLAKKDALPASVMDTESFKNSG